ncbi:MAG TPA: hypothetical protein VHQ44_06895, partial [Thermoanaerobaculia bacterium]|nr:hypothetical protein [Thermoanaerobaculia bacterium]
MLARRTLEVPLPECAVLNDVDLELLKASFQTLVALRCEKGREWEGLLRQLKEDGWTVRWGLTWRAEAKRGEDYEEATGPTLDDALR